MASLVLSLLACLTLTKTILLIIAQQQQYLRQQHEKCLKLLNWIIEKRKKSHKIIFYDCYFAWTTTSQIRCYIDAFLTELASFFVRAINHMDLQGASKSNQILCMYVFSYLKVKFLY